MTCEEFAELVTAFLVGALGPAAEARFVEHLALCEGCEIHLAQFRITIAELGALLAESLSADIRGTVLDAFRDQHAR
ncbi:zf-HC2 domain-containing protein [Amycolatopsis balhimycina DSM 5908]|uniref:Zf-HC2 domain-containing protein n=1 Tax=Amycolatopsis balhimycina DSM 5908 TaxID=1081091 RepID=A0A428W3W3_AMYBA|nr:zf-HC2 domain-containing protein [Amycolatopsis balhimycina]RSM37768.1 zf-HC2 domain-containing protein [Amycolatopsis balhimycina DSM 5908]